MSVQDLRRDLREADEDRYRLLVRTGDWRHPRVGVQEIRRQLREADEDRFRLTMRVRTLVKLIKGAGIGVCLLLAAGVASAFWTKPSAPQVAAAGHAVAQPSATKNTAITGTTAGTDATGAVQSMTVKTVNADRADRAARVPPASRTRTPLPNVVSTNRAGAASEEKTVIRRRPRPLHPGEFGRRL